MTSTGSTPPTRKPRKKQWASEIARQNHSNNRRKLARETSDRQAKSLERARLDLSQAEQRIVDAETNRRLNMVGNGLTPRLRAVMNSWGLNLTLSIAPANQISAWTDFQQIVVNHDYRLVPNRDRWNVGRQEAIGRVVTVSELREISAETRGLFYHELGHNLFTVPFADLLAAAHAAGWSDPSGQISRGSSVPVPGDFESLEGSGSEKFQWTFPSAFQKAWNVLEDQRMECALVEDSPQIAAYLTVMVMRQIVGQQGSKHSWSLAAGRLYLPDTVRDASRNLWNENSDIPGDVVEALVSRYSLSDSASEMLDCVVEMRDILDDVIIKGGDDHSRMAADPKLGSAVSSGGDSSEAEEKISDVASKTAASSDLPKSAEGDTIDGPAGDESGGESSNDASKAETGKGSGSGTYDTDYSDSWGQKSKDIDAIGKARQDALDALADDQTITDDVASINDAHATDDGSLPQYGRIKPSTDADLLSKAQSIVGDIERAFQIATEDCAPHWSTQQRQGYLDPIRYTTRQPGDMEIFRNYADSGEPGNNIAVSLFLDISGSMDGTGEELGAAAWAVKTACQVLSIECEVTLFNERGFKLWSINESPDMIPDIEACGGTNPSAAFGSVLTEERAQSKHLVLVLTDGDWGGDDSYMSNFKHANSHNVVFFFSPYEQYKNGLVPSPAYAAKLKADEAYLINDLMEIPVALESLLTSLV